MDLQEKLSRLSDCGDTRHSARAPYLCARLHQSSREIRGPLLVLVLLALVSGVARADSGAAEQRCGRVLGISAPRAPDGVCRRERERGTEPGAGRHTSCVGAVVAVTELFACVQSAWVSGSDEYVRAREID